MTFPRILQDKNAEAWALLYAMGHVAEFSSNRSDADFARRIRAEARENPYWLPSQDEFAAMKAIEQRFYAYEGRHPK